MQDIELPVKKKKGGAMPGAGRPRKLTPELSARILATIRAGNYRVVAAQEAGIYKDTLMKWIAQGRKDSSGLYFEFANAVEEAEMQAEVAMVEVVINAAKKDAKHAEWWLEHKCRQRWAAHVQIDLRQMTDEQILEALENFTGGADSGGAASGD